MLRIGVGLCALFAAVPTMAFDPASPFGVTAFIPGPTRWQAMQDGMIVWNRCAFEWRTVELSQNNFDWSQTDQMVAEANARGLKIYAGLSYSPPWATSDGNFRRPAANPADWADYCTQVVNRYKASIQHWELWNEPNLTQFFIGTRQQYIDQVLKVGADAIHAADPNAKVIGPEISTCTASGCAPTTWMTDVLNQAGTKIDIISHHQYDGGDAYPGRLTAIDNMHNTIVNAGYGNKDTWISESGFRSDGGSNTETTQSNNLVGMLRGMETRPWFKKFFWYQIWEGGAGTEKWGLLYQNETKKPSWFAYRDYVFASNWGPQTPFGGSPRSVPGMIQAEDFDEGGGGVGYGDADGGNNGGAYRSTDVDIEATGDTGGGFNVGWTAGGEFLKYTINVANAGTYSIQLRVAAPASPAGSYHIQVGGINKTGVLNFPVTGGWQTYQTVTVSNISLSAGTQVLKLYIDSGGFNLNWINVTTGGSPPGVASNPNPGNGASGVNRNADVSWTAGSGATSHDVLFGTTNPPPFVQNQGGTSFDPGTLLASTTYFWRIDEKNSSGTTTGPVWSFTTTSATNSISVKVAGAITIDGNSSDWNLAQFVTKSRGGEFTAGDIALVGFDGGSTVYRGAYLGVLPTSAADHTVKIYSRHDATYQYFLARIDDSNIQTPNGVALNWANDCVEFFIDPSNNGGSSAMSNSTSDIQLTIDAINQKNVYMCTSGYASQVLAGVTSAVTTDASGWWLEVRIQKSAIDPDMPASGTFGLDFNIRDNDNNNDPALTTVYTWAETSTAGFPSKIPDHWGDATLVSGPQTISNSAFPSNADGWNIVVWKSGPYENGTMAWSSSGGNPTGNMLAGASGGTNNTDSCNREGGEVNKTISTAGYNSIQVQYDLRFSTDQTGTTCAGSCTPLEGNCADKIAVYYSTAGTGGPWTLLEAVNASTVTQNVWATRTINCPAAANNQANFALRFRFQFNTTPNDSGRLDNIKVIGTP